jgi:hypothetical protein
MVLSGVTLFMKPVAATIAAACYTVAVARDVQMTGASESGNSETGRGIAGEHCDLPLHPHPLEYLSMLEKLKRKVQGSDPEAHPRDEGVHHNFPPLLHRPFYP